MSAFPDPLTGMAAPLDPGALRDNVDTDAIIPSREMRSTGRDGLADGLFAPWRYADADARRPDPGFVLNRTEYADAPILVAGDNFGCGSSREHAVWALGEWGIKVILAASFAPIFHANCIRNFLLPITQPRVVLEQVAGSRLTIDLAAQTIRTGDAVHRFDIDPEAKRMLAEGLDPIDLTLIHTDHIERWITRDRASRPWVYLEASQ